MKNRNRRKKTPPIDRDGVEILDKSDVFVFSMGWLWSLHGFVFAVFCAAGLYTGIEMFEQYLNRGVVEITDYKEALRLKEGRVIKVTGRIDKDEIVEFENKLWQKWYALAIIENTDRKIMVYIDSPLSDEEKNSPVSQDYTGKIYKTGSVDVKIRRNRIDAKRVFKSKGVDIHDEYLIISNGEMPEMQWWYIVILLGCGYGVLYIARRIIKSWWYRNNRQQFYEDIVMKMAGR